MTSPKVGKVAVVTGSNKGIGLHIVKALCTHFKKEGDDTAVVYLTARDRQRGNAAVAQLQQEGFNPKFHQLDIEEEDSVVIFAEHIQKAHGGLDILVNNAAISFFTNLSAPLIEQAEETMDINYFGTLNVCKKLFPLLRPHSRVVNVSSGLGHLSKINAKRPGAVKLRERFASPGLTEESLTNLVKEYIKCVKDGNHQTACWPNSAYGVSKIAVCALTRVQQRLLDSTRPYDDLVVNSCHPGWVKTGLTGFKGHYTPEEGAIAPTWAALLPPDIMEPRGDFIWQDTSLVDWVNGPLPANF